jgi:hypothetical protein
MKFLPPMSDRDRQTPGDPREQKNWLSLLLVSRKTYRDTLLLPFEWNCFSVTRVRFIGTLLGMMYSEQRAMITAVQLEVEIYGTRIDRTRTVYTLNMAGGGHHDKAMIYLWHLQLNSSRSLLRSVQRVEVVALHTAPITRISPLTPESVAQEAWNHLEKILSAAHDWSAASIISPNAILSRDHHCTLYPGVYLLLPEQIP